MAAFKEWQDLIAGLIGAAALFRFGGIVCS
jgi:hypothetical protein